MKTETQKIATFAKFHNANQKALRYKVSIFVPSPETMHVHLRMISQLGYTELNFMEVLN